MRGVILDWAYRRLGRHYPVAFVALELQAAFLITGGTVFLLSFYYDGSGADFALIYAVTLSLTAVTLIYGFLKIRPRLAPVKAWIAGWRDPASTARAWTAAISLPLDVVKREMLLPIALVIVPGCVTAVLVLDLAWTAMFPLLAASMVSVGYGAILHYLTIEAGMRPVLLDIDRAAPPRLATGIRTVPLAVRLLAALPMINIITGLVVAALTGDGTESLAVAVLAAVGVATTVSLELTLLLSRSVLMPLRDLQEATERVARGDYSVSVPVTSADELGHLAASFNQMVGGLADRERIREAFGTYLDHEIAEYILSEGFDEGGMEAEVTTMFCDVVDFTRFAAGADAREVVGALNALFDVVVPVIAAEGGHIDKFEGDGLMAVFGAPEPAPDHAARAVRAALEIDRRVNREGEGGPFQLGIGLNTGRVIAGSVGGGGRLNFSVIGDAVNVASRVQDATRSTGDAILMTDATRARLPDTFAVLSRGAHELKGVGQPLELFAAEPARVEVARP
jgi:class 3 adenylate cyclase